MAFKDIAHWALIGIGSVLSVIPAVGPIVGGGLIATGASIPLTAHTTSADPVSNAASQLQAGLLTAQAMTAAGQGQTVINANSLVTWLQKNLMLILGALAAIFLLPKLFKMFK